MGGEVGGREKRRVEGRTLSVGGTTPVGWEDMRGEERGGKERTGVGWWWVVEKDMRG